MTVDHVTLRERIAVTRSMIAEEGIPVALSRPSAPEPDGAGGFTRNDTPTPQNAVQRFLGYPTPDLNESLIEQGEYMPLRFVLVGMPGDDMSEGDTFEHQGRTFKVELIHPDKSYQVKGEGTVLI